MTTKYMSLDDTLEKSGVSLGGIFEYLEHLSDEGKINSNTAAVSYVCGRFQIGRVYAKEVVEIWRPDR
mgnify:CR=1 FL=1